MNNPFRLFGSISNNELSNTSVTGTQNIKFFAVIGQDQITKNGVQSIIQTCHQCITAMNDYKEKSLEELRQEDYNANFKFPKETFTLASSAKSASSFDFGSSFNHLNFPDRTQLPSSNLFRNKEPLSLSKEKNYPTSQQIVYGGFGSTTGSIIQEDNQLSSSILGKIKTDFWSLDNLSIAEKLEELNKLKIILPCGFDIEYGKKYFKQTNFNCPICKDHNISSQDCLNMTRNKLVLNEKLFELKKKIFEQLTNNFEEYKNDPEYYIELSHDRCINETDLRRKKLNVMLKEKIDDYYKDLLKEINTEKESKLKSIDFKIKEVDSKREEIYSLNVENNLDVYSKINALQINQKSIDNGINLVTNIQDYLTQAKFKLTDTKTEIDLESLFGELYLKEETAFIYNEDEIGDDNRSEATIQLVINDFSKLSNKKNLKIYSKMCRVKNFEWSIMISLAFHNILFVNTLEFYLKCNAIDGLSRFPVKVNAQFTLVDLKNQNNLVKFQKFSFINDSFQGFNSFLKFNDLSDLDNFYNHKDDSITLKVAIK